MKRYFIIAFLTLSSAFSFSQSFKGGILAGLAGSQVDGDTYSGYNRLGFAAGAYVGHDISDKFDWQFELKYIQKGSHKRQNPDAGDLTIYKLRLNYVEVPFTIRYKYKPKISFDAGLGVGYLASTKEEDEYGVFPANLLKPFNKFELSYQIGGYYQLFKNLLFNIRYSYSVLPIRTGIVGQRRILFGTGQFNNLISFSFYYQLNKADE
jgi:hypothetical protein